MKIILIGDIHFGKLSSTTELSVPGEPIQDKTNGAKPLIKSFVDDISKIGADYLFVVGDLTSTGSPVEYSRCINELYAIASAAGIDSKNVIIGVGNHDVDRKIVDLAQLDNSMTADYPLVECKKLYQNIAASHGQVFYNTDIFDVKGPAPFSGIIIRDNIIIYLLNSSWLCSSDPNTKHGKLDATQLEWFNKAAEQYVNDRRWKFVLLHHHPFNYPYPTVGRDITLLEEGAELVDIAGKTGINVICHGHRHHPKAHNEQHDDWSDPITFVCTGSFSVNAKHRSLGSIPNTYHVLELDNSLGSKVVMLKSYQYSLASGWEPIRINCPETPLDQVMIFERPYDDKSRLLAINDLVSQEFKKVSGQPFVELPTWKNLPLQLKTLRFDKLDDAIRRVANDNFNVIGKYPDPVVLIRRS